MKRLLVLLIAVAVAPRAWGQVNAQAQTNLERFERTLNEINQTQRQQVNREVPMDQRMLLEYGFTLSENFLAIDDIGQKTHILRQTTGSTYLHANFDGVHDFFLRASSTYNDFNDGDAFDNHGDDWVEPTLDRAVYTFDLRKYFAAYKGRSIEGNAVLQGGRQLVHWANGLALSQELDGALITLSQRPLELQILAGTTRDSANDFESSRPGFDHDTHRNFFGSILTYTAIARHQPYMYELVQQDDNRDEVLTVGATSTTFQYNSFYLGGGSQGSITDRLVYGVEAVFEGGRSRSNSFDNLGAPVPQTDDPIRAWAVDGRLDYIFPGVNRTRLGAELLLASGDGDRGHSTNTFNGNAPGTADHGYNGFGLIDTGVAFGPNPSNLIMVRMGAATFPLPNSRLFRRLQIGTNLFVFNKMNEQGGVTEATSNNRYLGIEPDVFAIWQVTSDISIQTRYGVFFPGQAITADNDERHFFYTGVTYSF